MKNIISLLAFFALLPLKAQTLIATDNSHSLSLNGTWNFHYDNSQDKSLIKVPGNWDMQGFGEPVYGHNRSSMYNKERPSHNGIYQRSFRLPGNWRKKQIWIAFDGVENGFSLFINGDSIGAFHSAFNRSMFNISHAVKFDKDNDITVKVTQTGMPYWEFDTNDDWAFGGISRDITLYAIPQNNIKDFTVSYDVNGKDASVNLSLETQLEKHGWKIELFDATNKKVYENRNLATDQLTFNVSNAKLWSAETPYLYTLRISLLKGNKVQQTIEKKIGIRSISWNDGIFRINGDKVKLKGINHHDESPVNGRAMTETEMLKDLYMMKAANINAIRCSHYPPSPHFMDMLDSLGFYAICEVPFGFGDKYLGNPSTLPELKKRAYFTVMRDKNRPSVVIWSVGNENPITANGLKTAHYVLSLDPTRPNLFPNTHKPFLQEITLDDDSITMYSCHYPLKNELRKWPSQLKHPLVNTECAHALGLDLGQIEGLVEEWYKHDKLAGGCVWGWADQGILKDCGTSSSGSKNKRPASRYETTQEVWLTPNRYYDMKGILGTDGIVYPNRFPQTDYWQIRSAYSPVVIKKDHSGTFHITNRYDFTNLNALSCTVEYFNKAQLAGTFKTRCDVAPGTTKKLRIFEKLPQRPYGFATVTFTNSKGDELYKQSFRLNDDNLQLPIDSISGIKAPFLTTDSIGKWLKANILMRIGRKPSLSSEATLAGSQGKTHHVWSNYLLKPTSVSPLGNRKEKNSAQHDFAVRFNCDSTHHVNGTISVCQYNNGPFRITYKLQCTGDGEALETGLTIRTKMKCPDTSLRYMGHGPYACYPGRTALSWYGHHHLQADDIYFPGNRLGVTIAMLQDKDRSFVIIPREGDNICVERTHGGTIDISHNASVASPFNKNIWPENTQKTDGLKVNGSFDILVTTNELKDSTLRDFLFTNTAAKPTSQPFYNSYDQ